MGIPTSWEPVQKSNGSSNNSSSHSASLPLANAAHQYDSSPTDLVPFPAAADGHRSLAELKRVKEYFATKSQSEVLMYCLGLINLPDAPELAKSTIAICVDTEGWNANSSVLTEVGFCNFEPETMQTTEPGPFGENLLQNTYFYHIRVAETAHYKNFSAAAEMDTQILARELDYWQSPKNQVGLKNLVAKLDFEYRDPHTSSNDAAMTLIVALLLVLPEKYYKDQPKTLQHVIDEVEKTSKTCEFDYSSEEHCFRCQQPGHMERKPDSTKLCTVPVRCTLCEEAGKTDPRRKRAMNSHMAAVCILHGLHNGNSVIAQAKKAAKLGKADHASLDGVASALEKLDFRDDGRRGDHGRMRAFRTALENHAYQGRARHLARGGAAGFLSAGPYVSGVSGHPDRNRFSSRVLNARGGSQGGFKGRGG
ncbi:hypothetical protein BU23DRAFT_572770 [Bimuria novae-zelandiae CBS 107.79]|uniref:Gfd2/YDR514C-like C-terminal domain-containing protein n=1 Tax=Bimuria novae-zelandiae CBS 107.79 TaxID=1447943 RepID=A0A6A5UTB9_9PLEO|nr:hypothetical protein BU23DRAFT_572770 [Bimuria novae-zelandiae CBS 107.79]